MSGFNDCYDCIVIGGGPAGLMAAATSAKNGKSTLLLEKNDKLGKKLRITGKGRCNITNSCDTEDMLSQIPSNPSFLYSALYSFTNNDIITLLNSMGVQTKIERGGRVFPVSDCAHDVANALCAHALKSGAKIEKRSVVTDIVIENKKAAGVRINSEILRCKAIILATGGLSYPTTGSTGDGYKFARKAGHTITPLRPSLAPLTTEERLPL